ncbi:Flp pilus assembly protein TadD, contains TPR repeats [Jhaorihella thermophila]|uniref:Flp pilus assembly protein TadD, contains TPR repeats n=1 Tax=Jhaorihella thermophila TaxID=488547 RepID=A0A1H5W9S1_9RHOB|nr:Flp pilus assembly protein TadD, contains TPR repeats [Jhaorihella thermophila]
MSFLNLRAAVAALAASLTVSVAGPSPVHATSFSGAYLAGRQAMFDDDFNAAAEYYRRALGFAPDNAALMEKAVQSLMALGRFDEAVPIARRIEEQGLRSQAAHMVVLADLVAKGDFATVLQRGPDQGGVGPLVDGLVQAWARLGAGSVKKGLAQFDRVAEESGVRGFAMYHKALALASVGDFEGAEAVFSGDGGSQSLISRRAVLARARILSQLGRNDDALQMLADAFAGGTDPALTAVADQLASGARLPFDMVRSPREGIAEVFYSIGAALDGDAADEYVLLYARMAAFLDPMNLDAQIMAARILERLGQYDLAVEAYKQIPADRPEHFAAELGRAEVLRQAGKIDAAIEVLEQLSRSAPQQPQVASSLGDLLRQQNDYAGAEKAYTRALELTDEDSPDRWFLHYARGISRERQDKWPEAEADFRKALELNPGQPQVLNYLGYSLVEKKVKLDEALALIEKAVEARPDSGYIVDSLGWVLFRLGRYDEAVGHMEKAVELMPVDPVVTDHLGDVYWAVGRYREARFQWRRALSFISPDEENQDVDPDRIRRKLEVGLDRVLAEEGSPPLMKVADGDN